MDSMAYGKPSVVGAINGMIAGLVGITPAAGYVNGWGAIIIGVCTGIIPWLAMNKLQTTTFMKKVDDTLSVFSTHGVAGLIGGLLVGVLANPDMLDIHRHRQGCAGRQRHRPALRRHGNQLLVQIEAAAFIIVYNAITTFIILKVISIFVPLRMDEATLRVGDDAVHGETAYAISASERRIASPTSRLSGEGLRAGKRELSASRRRMTGRRRVHLARFLVSCGRRSEQPARGFNAALVDREGQGNEMLYRFGQLALFCAALLLCWSACRRWPRRRRRPRRRTAAAPPAAAAAKTRQRRHRLDADLGRARADDDHSRAGAVLRRHGAQEERARHRDAELHGHLPRHRAVDDRQLQHGLHQRHARMSAA